MLQSGFRLCPRASMTQLAELTIPPVSFLGEQDGPAEQRLKQALDAVLRKSRIVASAYLCRILYEDNTPGVALGLATRGEESEALVNDIGATFASIFNASAHLDVFFLSEQRHAEIRKVCPAFYQRSWWR
jgi:hypothetical protein